MATRKKPGEEKSTQGLNFSLQIPVNFSISAPMSLQKKFREKVGDNYSRIFKRWMMEVLGVPGEQEMLKKYPEIKQDIKKLRNTIKNQMGVTENEFSSEYRKRIQEMVNEE